MQDHQECCQQCEEEAFPFLICWSSVSSVGLGEGGQEEEGGLVGAWLTGAWLTSARLRGGEKEDKTVGSN